MSRSTLAALFLALAAPALAADGANAASTYKVSTDGSPRTLKLGETGKVVVAVVPLEKGIHVNREFPLKYRLEPSAGLRTAKTELTRADAVDPGADNPRFEIPVTAGARGEQKLVVQMRFAICSDAWCAPQTKTVTLPIDVK